MKTDPIKAEARKERLRTLIASDFHNSQAEFSKATGKPETLVNRILSGKKNMGEAFAAGIDRALNKPSGWFDSELKQKGSNVAAPQILTQREKRLIDRFRILDEPIKRAIEGAAGIPFTVLTNDAPNFKRVANSRR